MTTTTLVDQMKSFMRLGDPLPVGIHSTDRFQAILRRERERADRNTHGFTLIVFSVGFPDRNARLIRRLARELQPRCRATDDLGWVSGGRLGAFLPETSVEGATKYGNDVCGLTTAVEARVTFTLHPYSSRSDGDSGGDGSGREPEHTSSTSDDHTAPVQGAVGLASHSSLQDFGQIATAPAPFWKRSIDIAGALLALTLFSPIMLAAAALIKIVSPGPIFFRQERIGRMGSRFTMLKFRTMKPDCDTAGHEKYLASLMDQASGDDKPMVKIDGHDPRIILFGRVMRKLSIDELPQLLNVLVGDMSLVGPRPPIPYEADKYMAWHNQRLDAVPGMTGLWQVSGKNSLTFHEMVSLDINYAKRTRLWLDLTIILKTIPVVIGLGCQRESNKVTEEVANGEIA